MFFREDRIDWVRRMIFAGTRDERVAALEKILPMQRDDFVGVIKAMDGYPVTVRLLDPPLHEFVPTQPDDIRALSKRIGVDLAALEAKIRALHEFNPMLGHRGCRIGITFPEIYQIQVRAIMEAACAVQRDHVVVATHVRLSDENLRDARPARARHHLFALRRIEVDPDFLPALALALEEVLGGDAVGTDGGGVKGDFRGNGVGHGNSRQ
jgi:hypothetical protein